MDNISLSCFSSKKIETNLTFEGAMEACQASLVAQMVKHLPAMRETQVQSLGWEAPLEKEMATHSSTLAWKIPWAEEPGGLQSWDHKESDMTEQLHFVLHFNI